MASLEKKIDQILKEHVTVLLVQNQNLDYQNKQNKHQRFDGTILAILSSSVTRLSSEMLTLVA